MEHRNTEGSLIVVLLAIIGVAVTRNGLLVSLPTQAVASTIVARATKSPAKIPRRPTYSTTIPASSASSASASPAAVVKPALPPRR